MIAKFTGHHVFFDLQVDKWWILFSYFQYQRQMFSTWLSIHLLVLSVLIYRMIIYLRLKVCILYVQSVMVDWISIIWNWSLYFVTLLKSNKISIACTYLFVIIFPAIQSFWVLFKWNCSIKTILTTNTIYIFVHINGAWSLFWWNSIFLFYYLIQCFRTAFPMTK